jgi:hypothetical protein
MSVQAAEWIIGIVCLVVGFGAGWWSAGKYLVKEAQKLTQAPTPKKGP